MRNKSQLPEPQLVHQSNPLTKLLQYEDYQSRDWKNDKLKVDDIPGS